MMLRLLILISSVAVATSKLVHVHVLYRHGDRGPIAIYPKDPHQADVWPDGLGMLTTIGREQAFQLGRYLRQRYGGLISANYNSTEIHVRSTDYDRTLTTAESCLSGLYLPRTESEQFSPLLRWNPIPVHTVANDDDILLHHSNCPRIGELMGEIYDSPVVTDVDKRYATLFTSLSNHTGVVPFTFGNVGRLQDTMLCERSHNLTQPGWATGAVFNTLTDLSNFGWRLDYYTEELRRLCAGFLLNEVLDHLQALANGTSGRLPRGRRMEMYSAHDTTVSAFLAAAGVFNGVQPPYVSAVLTELHHEGGRHLVRLYFRNSSTAATPHRLVVPGCTHACPLAKLAKLWAPTLLRPADRKASCRLINASSGSRYLRALSLSLAALGLVLVLCVAAFVVGYVLRRQRYGPYRRLDVPKDDEEEQLEMNGAR